MLLSQYHPTLSPKCSKIFLNSVEEISCAFINICFWILLPFLNIPSCPTKMGNDLGRTKMKIIIYTGYLIPRCCCSCFNWFKKAVVQTQICFFLHANILHGNVVYIMYWGSGFATRSSILQTWLVSLASSWH